MQYFETTCFMTGGNRYQLFVFMADSSFEQQALITKDASAVNKRSPLSFFIFIY